MRATIFSASKIFSLLFLDDDDAAASATATIAICDEIGNDCVYLRKKFYRREKGGGKKRGV